MQPRIRRRTVLIAACAALALPAVSAFAQAYPTKPVRLIVPYPAGGGTDFFARTVGQKLSQGLGQPLIVENKPGAATIIGAETVAKSPADGYTVLLADSTTLAVNPSLYKKLQYDPVKDFANVSLTARFAMLLVVNPTLSKATNVKAFIDEAKKAQGQMNYASVGAGTTHHLTMELFKERVGIQLTHVPYKGAAPAIQDVVGGQVPAMFVDLAAGGPLIKAGKLRVLGVASPKRIPGLPDVPTLAEQGVSNFEAWAWQGLIVPTGTPKDIIARLNNEYAKAVSDPGVRQALLDAGIEPVTSTPEEMSAYVKSETEKWARVIKQADIKIE
jgi:tripartite-type tricarboxylate transporter receptor subunit TctC